ncbi:MAG: hypothetical protein U9Q16_01395 [Patescibacteria group bacterium]|nr:hypothetical protein [Patescibacteria group bacterium]
MAQPTLYLIKYTGSIEVDKGVPYAGSSVSLGNVLQMKTKGVSVVINSSGPAFTITYDDLAFLDATATYTFNKDCIIAIGDMVEVV